MRMHAFGKLLPLREAQARVAAAVRPIGRTEEVPLAEATGRIAARTVRSTRPVPSVDRAGWDGYAVRSVDTRGARPALPVELKVVAELFAEQSTRRALRAREAAAVATGASLPPGADAVAIFEEVKRLRGVVRLTKPVRAGDRITPAGHDVPVGTLLVRDGAPIAPASVGALAACGQPSVRVYARPRVALIATGNELVVPGHRARAGAVFESNLPAMEALVRAAGAIPRVYPPVEDRPDAIERVLREALRVSDLVLVTGGSSVGERDHLPKLFPRLGRLLFHGVAVRPGKPTLAARRGSTLLLGLPGHPASCLSNMLWLGVPAVRRLARQPGPGWRTETAVLRGPSLGPTETMALVVPLEHRNGTVRSTYRGSSAITSLAGANGFVVLPPKHQEVRPGSRLSFCRLEPTGA